MIRIFRIVIELRNFKRTQRQKSVLQFTVPGSELPVERGHPDAGHSWNILGCGRNNAYVNVTAEYELVGMEKSPFAAGQHTVAESVEQRRPHMALDVVLVDTDRQAEDDRHILGRINAEVVTRAPVNLKSFFQTSLEMWFPWHRLGERIDGDGSFIPAAGPFEAGGSTLEFRVTFGQLRIVTRGDGAFQRIRAAAKRLRSFQLGLLHGLGSSPSD